MELRLSPKKLPLLKMLDDILKQMIRRNSIAAFLSYRVRGVTI
jgi:hypothetical protein